MQESVHIYNPLNRGKGVGRRTGKVIQKKRNINNGVDNFDDYLSSDGDGSMNITDASVFEPKNDDDASDVLTHISKSEKHASLDAQLINATKTSTSTLLRGSSTEASQDGKTAHLLTRNSRFGRRTGKDLLFGKDHKDLNNFSSYLSDFNETGSLNPSPVQPSSMHSKSSSSRRSTAQLSSPRENSAESNKENSDTATEAIHPNRPGGIEQREDEEDPLGRHSSKHETLVKLDLQRSVRNENRASSSTPVFSGTEGSSDKESDAGDVKRSLRKKRILINSGLVAKAVTNSGSFRRFTGSKESVNQLQGLQKTEQGTVEKNQLTVPLLPAKQGDEGHLRLLKTQKLDGSKNLNHENNIVMSDSGVKGFEMKTSERESVRDLNNSQIKDRAKSVENHVLEPSAAANISSRHKNKIDMTVAAKPPKEANFNKDKSRTDKRTSLSNSLTQHLEEKRHRTSLSNSLTQHLEEKRHRTSLNTTANVSAKTRALRSNGPEEDKDLDLVHVSKSAPSKKMMAETNQKKTPHHSEALTLDRGLEVHSSVEAVTRKKYTFDDESDSAPENWVAITSEQSFGPPGKESNSTMSTKGSRISRVGEENNQAANNISTSGNGKKDKDTNSRRSTANVRKKGAENTSVNENLQRVPQPAVDNPKVEQRTKRSTEEVSKSVSKNNPSSSHESENGSKFMSISSKAADSSLVSRNASLAHQLSPFQVSKKSAGELHPPSARKEFQTVPPSDKDDDLVSNGFVSIASDSLGPLHDANKEAAREKPAPRGKPSSVKCQSSLNGDEGDKGSMLQSLSHRDSSVQVKTGESGDFRDSQRKQRNVITRSKRGKRPVLEVVSSSAVGKDSDTEAVFMSISSKKAKPGVEPKESHQDDNGRKEQAKSKRIKKVTDIEFRNDSNVLKEDPVQNENSGAAVSAEEKEGLLENLALKQKKNLPSETRGFRKRKSPVLDSQSVAQGEGQSPSSKMKKQKSLPLSDVYKTDTVDSIMSVASKASFASIDLKDTPKTGNRQKYRNSRRKIFSDPILEIVEDQVNQPSPEKQTSGVDVCEKKTMKKNPPPKPQRNPRIVVKKSKSQRMKAERKRDKNPQKIVSKKVVKPKQDASEKMESFQCDVMNGKQANRSLLTTSATSRESQEIIPSGGSKADRDNSLPSSNCNEPSSTAQNNGKIQEGDGHAEDQREIAVLYTEKLKSSPVRKRGRPRKSTLESEKRKNPSKSLSPEGSPVSGKDNEMSSPVSLRLIDSLPNVTPRSGVSFRRFRNLSLTQEKSGESPDPYRFTLQRFQQPDTESTPLGRMNRQTNGLTSCLRDPSVARPFKKNRRVRISNFIKSAGTAAHRKQSLVSEYASTTLLSPSSSPVHYAETTLNKNFNAEQPSFVLPDLSHLIVRPEERETTGLRRSSRTRVKPVAAYKGERVIYRRDSSGYGLVVDAIQPSIGEAKLKANEEKRRKRVLKKRIKAMNVPAKPNKRLSSHVHNLSVQLSESNTLPAKNPDNDEDVLIEMISRRSGVQWKGPDLEPVLDTDPLAGCVQLQQPSFCSGEIHLRALAEKPFEKVMQTLVYSVSHGLVYITINGKHTVVETGDDFFIPRGSAYGMKNLRRDVARLHFVCLQDDL